MNAVIFRNLDGTYNGPVVVVLPAERTVIARNAWAAQKTRLDGKERGRWEVYRKGAFYPKHGVALAENQTSPGRGSSW